MRGVEGENAGGSWNGVSMLAGCEVTGLEWAHHWEAGSGHVPQQERGEEESQNKIIGEGRRYHVSIDSYWSSPQLG
jgi:hypothetical protein